MRLSRYVPIGAAQARPGISRFTPQARPGPIVRTMTRLDLPNLPEPLGDMDWRDLHGLREDRPGTLYLTALRYARHLWRRELPARALLAVDRALYADLAGDEPELAAYPLPYDTVAFMVAQAPEDAFTGNARVHYQHLADRVRGPREGVKRWRAWAAWAVVRRVRPDLPGDPRHAVVEPDEATIAAGLDEHGVPGETDRWRSVLRACASVMPAR